MSRTQCGCRRRRSADSLRHAVRRSRRIRTAGIRRNASQATDRSGTRRPRVWPRRTAVSCVVRRPGARVRRSCADRPPNRSARAGSARRSGHCRSQVRPSATDRAGERPPIRRGMSPLRPCGSPIRHQVGTRFGNHWIVDTAPYAFFRTVFCDSERIGRLGGACAMNVTCAASAIMMMRR